MGKKIFFVALLSLISISFNQIEAGDLPTPESGVYPFDDLKPIDTIIGDAHFVGLGESVHASEGYIAAKLKVIQYLVEKKGFRAFEMETPWRAARRVNQYISTCQGSPKDALYGIFSVWWSESTVQLFKWLCEFNQSHASDPVVFFGFDTQSQTLEDIADLKVYLEKVAPSESAELIQGLTPCEGYGLTKSEYQKHTTLIFAGQYTVPDDQNASCVLGLDKIEHYLQKVPASNELEWAKIFVIGIRGYQGELYNFVQRSAVSFQSRDVSMAELVERLHRLISPTAKAILWAHNTHLSMHHDEVLTQAYSGALSMGTLLKQRLQNDYAPIGMVGYRVGFLWPGQPPQEIPTPDLSGSVEGLLHQTGIDQAIVDLSGNFLKPGQDYGLQEEGMVPSRQFKGLIFLDRSPPMVPPQ